MWDLHVGTHCNATSSLEKQRILLGAHPNRSTICNRYVLSDPLPPRKKGGRERIGMRNFRYLPRLFGAKVMACGHRGAQWHPRHVWSSVITSLAWERLSVSGSGSRSAYRQRHWSHCYVTLHGLWGAAGIRKSTEKWWAGRVTVGLRLVGVGYGDHCWLGPPGAEDFEAGRHAVGESSRDGD
jgi:hypothetical protein